LPSTFSFHISMVVLGRFSQRLGLVTASLFYGGGIVFAGVAALYLYVTGRYLSGTFNFSVYTTYLFVESVMGLAGTAAGVAGTWRFRQVKPVETGVASFTGVEVIDEEMGFRHPSIVVVSGPPGSGSDHGIDKAGRNTSCCRGLGGFLLL
jgi:hypothetical protein